MLPHRECVRTTSSTRREQHQRSGEIFSIRVLRGADELQEHSAELTELSSAALEPNVFYEPWMLLPALRAFAGGTPLELMLVYRTVPESNRPPLLCGLLPLERRASWRGFPLSTLRLWQHIHCVLGTPLLRKDCADSCWEFILDWLAAHHRRCTLLELPNVTGDGPFSQLLIRSSNRNSTVSAAVETTARALFRPRLNAQAYLEAALSSKRRQEFRRMGRRLGEAGRLEFRSLMDTDACSEWVDAFLKLEAQGWKGSEGTALGQELSNREFFRAMTEGAFERQRLMMLGLFLNGKPVALKCNLLAGSGAYAFKIAYDEQYAKYSPGVLLELYNIERLHEMTEIAWMDSCAIPDHPMIDHLWLDQRTIQTVLISLGSIRSDLFVSLLPFLRWFKRRFLRLQGLQVEPG